MLRNTSLCNITVQFLDVIDDIYTTGYHTAAVCMDSYIWLENQWDAYKIICSVQEGQPGY